MYTAGGREGVRARRIRSIVDAHNASLRRRISGRLCHLLLRVQMRSIDPQSYGRDQKHAQRDQDQDQCLPGLALSSSNRYFQNVMTPWLVLLRFTENGK